MSQTEMAVVKLEGLISESQSEEPESESQAEEQKLFPLDQTEIVRELEVIYDEDTKITLYHKLRWPTFEALVERQRQTPYKTQVLGGGRTKTENDDGVIANARVWDKFAVAVKGYEYAGVSVDLDQWLEVTPGLAYEIPSEHKHEAIIGLFDADFEVEKPKGKWGYVLGAQTYRVKQTYGPYVIWHVFNKPTDADRRDLNRKSYEIRNQPGAKKARREVYTNLKPFCELYDKLFDHLEGVTGSDPDIVHRKDLVSPLWKLSAIDALMTGFEAPRRDLSKN